MFMNILNIVEFDFKNEKYLEYTKLPQTKV